MDLKGSQIKAFTDALLDAFGDYDSLEQMLRVNLDVRLSHIAAPEALPEVVYKLIQWAEQRDQVERLLMAARAANPGNEALHRFSQEVALTSDRAPESGWLETMVMHSVPFQDVGTWRERLGRVERCVCRVDAGDGQGVGTGFLIGPDLVLTNCHVADAFRSAPAAAGVRFDAAGAGENGPPKNGGFTALAPEWLVDSSPTDELDYAVLRLAGTPGRERGWLRPRAGHHFVPGEPLFILQHPRAQSMKLAVGSVTGVSVETDRVTYSVNTEPGSSGSPCFTAGWELVALHHRGGATGNQGVVIDAIARRLEEKHLLLDAEPPGMVAPPEVPVEADVFMSFADDVENGWAAKLLADLKSGLERRLGRSVHVACSGTPGQSAAAASLLVAVLSEGYVASARCVRELGEFHSAAGGERPGRTFLVEYAPARRPPALETLISYRLRTEERQEYHARLLDLVIALAQALAPGQPAGAPPADAGPAVLLAEVTDDLEATRLEVRRFLEQAGVRVLPAESYPSSPERFREALDADLARSALFVQLLSGVPGRRSADLPRGYAGLQYERASASATPVMQWRGEGVDVEQVADAAHRALLLGNSVRREPIEAFKRAVLEAFQKPKTPPPVQQSDVAVFVNADAADRPWAEGALKALVQGAGKGIALPVQSEDPGRVRKNLEAKLMICDALLFVYRDAPEQWVFRQVKECLKIIKQRDQPPRAVAVYDGPPPPPDKDELAFEFPGVRRLDCRSDDRNLVEFLESL